MAILREEYNRGYRQITFRGREPTLDANLREYIATAKQQGFERNKSEPASCERYRYHSRCTGVWDLYRETRGDDHINPIVTSATN